MGGLHSLQNVYMGLWLFSSTREKKKGFATTARFSYHVYFIYNLLFWMVAKILWEVVRIESVPAVSDSDMPF